MARIACLLVNNFSLAAITRINPGLRESPFAISRGKGPRAQLDQVSERARRMGIRPQMTAAQAQAICSDLVVINYSAAADTAAADALLDAAQSFAPLVEAGGPGCVFVDLEGMGRLFNSEPEMGTELARRVRAVGMDPQVGIGANKNVASLAARCGGMRVIPPGQERDFLNWLPLELLQLDPDTAARMARWGIRRLGELAAMDIREVGSRLGQSGVALIQIARGEEKNNSLDTRLDVRPARELYHEKIEIEYGIELLEPLSFLMRGLLERLTARLALGAMVGGDLLLSLEMADHRRDERRVAVAAPSNEVRSLLTLLSLSLEKTPPPAAVIAVQISIEPRPLRPLQNDLFLPPAPAPERLQATLARLAALCGPERVGVLREENSYRPEALSLGKFEPQPAPPQACPNGASSNRHLVRLVLRAIRPAEELEVMCEQGRPDFIRSRQLAARVVSIAGPWRRNGEWWSECAFARDYYDLALSDGGVYRVFFDLRNSRWFVDGIYD